MAASSLPRQRSTVTLDHLLHQWRLNLNLAEAAKNEYDEGLAIHRQQYPHLNRTSAATDYDKSHLAKKWSATEDWAIRRATMYGIAVLVERGHQQTD